eukprot:4305990-Amphidinium_carterae.1
MERPAILWTVSSSEVIAPNLLRGLALHVLRRHTCSCHRFDCHVSQQSIVQLTTKSILPKLN